jgi:hypothetical protein
VHVHQRRAIPWSKEKYTQKSNNKLYMYIKEGQYHGQKKIIHKRAITSRACTSKKGNTIVKRKKTTKGQ